MTIIAAKKYLEEKNYKEALKIFFELEKNIDKTNLAALIEIFNGIYKCFKETGDLKSAYDYYFKFGEAEHEKTMLENKEKISKLNAAMKIHQSQKETELLQEKNNELNKANIELNELRDKKNEAIKIVSEELKLPIVTIEGISLNYYKKIKEEENIQFEEIERELDMIEALSNEILKNVNSILEKNKAEQRE